jgi:hypothetical protein
MELRNYVEQTLCDIFDGPVDAQEYFRSNGGVINPNRGVATLHQIEFDVEVRTSDVAGKKGGAGLFVGPHQRRCKWIPKGKFVICGTNQICRPRLLPLCQGGTLISCGATACA